MIVAICEDNPKFAQQIETYINKYIYMEENGIQISLNTPHPEEVVKYIQRNQVDCFFLDINLGTNMTGLDLAKIIRKTNPLASIIFVTTHSEMLHLTFKYQVEALDFIIKDKEENLHQATIKALQTAFAKYEKIGERPETYHYQIKIGEYIKNIKLDEILYFKVAETAHKVNLFTKQGFFEFYDSLNEIENVYNVFFRSHRSYIVNLKNIQEVNWKEKMIIMQNGDRCPLSLRKVKLLKELLNRSNG